MRADDLSKSDQHAVRKRVTEWLKRNSWRAVAVSVVLFGISGMLAGALLGAPHGFGVAVLMAAAFAVAGGVAGYYLCDVKISMVGLGMILIFPSRRWCVLVSLLLAAAGGVVQWVFNRFPISEIWICVVVNFVVAMILCEICLGVWERVRGRKL